jgi:putative transposase
LRSDHVHMLVSIPPKYAVAAIVGYLKGKSAIHIARTYRGKERNFTGEHFWARGYFVSSVGVNEQMVREYIRNQEEEDIRRDQLKLFK